MEYYKLTVESENQGSNETYQEYEWRDALTAFLNAQSYDTKVTLTYVGEEFDEG